MRRTNTTDELDRLGAWARSTLGTGPRLTPDDIGVRGRRRRRRRRLAATGATAALVVMGLGLGVLAFGPTGDTTTVGGDAGGRPTTTLEPTTTGLAPLVLTVLKPLPEREPWPSAILTGALAFEDGCVFLQPDNYPERMLIVWKTGHWLDTGGPAPVVRAPDGSVVGGDGDTVRLTGGGVTGDVVKQLPLVDLRRSCVTTQIAYTSGTN